MRILIIEDTIELGQLLKSNLESDHFAVDVILNGTDGSYHARTNEYDLIILDNNLPGKNGMVVCSEIREVKDTPILMLSVLFDSAVKVDALNRGADDYLTKPFSYMELLARIHALLRRPKTIEKEILTVGHISLDNTHHSVFSNNKELHLTRKEFSLLRYFMKNAGRVLSRGLILEHIWDMQANPLSNSLDVHVQSLRRKIGDTEHTVIQTVSGRGYRMRESETQKSIATQGRVSEKVMR